MKYLHILLLLLLPFAAHSQAPTPSEQVLQEIFNNMVYVEGGDFIMGCTPEQHICYEDEYPKHQICLDDFKISKYPVTQRQWEEVMGTTVQQQRNLVNPRLPLWGECDDCPMYYVSWFEAQQFIMKLNQLTGKNYRLPTEAEWEYAARGGKMSKGYQYAGSDRVEMAAWMENNSNGARPVGQKLPNELGLYDMSGNVWEWCYDRFGNYNEYPQTNPTGSSSGNLRVLRGGCWANNANYCRLSIRGNDNPDTRDYCYGFRLVLP